MCLSGANDAKFRSMAKHAIFLSGPIGSGKTTLGRGLAARLSAGFVDGDDLSDPDRPWYCSILQTSRAIVHHASMIMDNSRVVVVAYPLGCLNWIYFRRRIAEVGATPLFVSLRASYSAIVDEQRGRLFDVKEHERIKIMIAEGYGSRPFSDIVIDTDQANLEATLAVLEGRIRPMIAPLGSHCT